MVYFVLKIFSNRVTLTVGELDESDGRSNVLSQGDTPRNNSLDGFVRNRSITVFIT